MKTNYIIQFVFGLFVLILGNGCATHALWHNDNLEAWNQPAPTPNLRLFESKQPADILVVYDEYLERSDVIHPRAYWLKENQKLLAQGYAPHFVSTKSAVATTAVPVFPTSANQSSQPPPYALVATNGQSFTLYLSNGTVETHDLPVYNDHKGKMEKFALTPLATAADITIVGGVFGYFFLEGLASSGASYSWKP